MSRLRSWHWRLHVLGMASILCNACAAVMDGFRHRLGLHCCAAPLHCLSPFVHAARRSEILALLQSVAVGWKADRKVWCCGLLHVMLRLACWLKIGTKTMAQMLHETLALRSWLCVQGKACQGRLRLPVGIEAHGERLRDGQTMKRLGGVQAILRGRHAIKLLGKCGSRPWG